jgi:Leucine-rich repeat (LRR) protein
MEQSLPSTSLNTQTEVLVISAPEGRHNELTIGPIFRHLAKLEELTISRSRVPAIGAHSFWGLKNLQLLDLTQNEIRQILDEHFRGLIELTKLHLDDNLIESMPSNTFMHMPELLTLTLARNRLRELVPRVFLKLGKLNTLDLSFNPLVDLNPEVFKDIQELHVLKCRSCGLSNINTLLYRVVPGLEMLDLSENQFKFLGADEFAELRRLQVLYLDGNQLSVVLDKTFGASTPNLRKLSLSRNRIAKVTTNAFVNSTSLRELDIGYNKIDHLEAAVLAPVSDPLHTLTLSGNLIPAAELKHALQSVLKLRELNLADMGISQLPIGIFVFHEHLTSLNLSGNAFTHFPSQILAPVAGLRDLDLSANKFRGLDARLVTRLEKAEVSPKSGAEVMAVTSRGAGGLTVNLDGNPWTCDQCHIGPLLDWITRFVKLQPDLSCELESNVACLRCTAPRSLAGRRVATLDPSSLEWCTTGTSLAGYGGDDEGNVSEGSFPRLGLLAAATAAAIAVLLLLAAVAAAAVAYNRHAAHYYTHEEERIQGNTEREAIFENPAILLDENGDLRFSPPGTYPDSNLTTKSGKKKKIKFVTIATIDEITKDPDLQANLTNGGS